MKFNRCRTLLFYLLTSLSSDFLASEEPVMVAIDAGSYRALYLTKDSEETQVDAFFIDQLPVSNEEFYKFVSEHTKWQKSRIPSVFAEENYLGHWVNVINQWQPDINDTDRPVIAVSWFAAKAYCESQNKRLPTVAEWEHVASASETSIRGSHDPDYNQGILAWYGRPTTQRVGRRDQSVPNIWGVKDMHGLIWEWTEDFNSALVSGESRADSNLDKGLFCGAGAAGSADPSNYAAFMRFGFRSSLKADFSLSNLGFRCASNGE